jgi:hypothetical protein
VFTKDGIESGPIFKPPLTGEWTEHYSTGVANIRVVYENNTVIRKSYDRWIDPPLPNLNPVTRIRWWLHR